MSLRGYEAISQGKIFNDDKEGLFSHAKTQRRKEGSKGFFSESI